jgi:hypothetical protein
MTNKTTEPQFVICLKNEDYLASLELRKIYQSIPDEKTAKRSLIRVIDESGEDYLYPKDYLASIKLAKDVKAAVLSAA